MRDKVMIISKKFLIVSTLLFFSLPALAESENAQEETLLASKTKCEPLPKERPNRGVKDQQQDEQDCLFDNWYVTASFGFASGDFSANQVTQAASDVGFDVFDIDVDDSRAAGKIAIGASLSERFSVEMGYVDLGEVKAAFSTNTDDPDRFFALTNNIHPTSTKGFAVSGIYQFLRHEDWFLQLRLGMFFWDGDYDSLDVFGNRPVENTSEADGNDLYFGAGANYQLDESLQLILEWERYRFDVDDTDLLSIGLTYHF